MYVDGGLTMPQIARQFNVSISTVQYRLEMLGIPRRSHSERIVTQARFGNSLEMEVKAILDELGFVYQHSKKIERSFFDYYLPDFHTLIECDGTFWHADPRFFPHRENLHTIQKKNLLYDQRKEELAKREGYRLLRFWEYDVWNNRQLVTSQLSALKTL
jgi:very-short-patch-repair endonuclease